MFVQRGIYIHFQERVGHNLRSPGVSNCEWRSRLGLRTLEHKFEEIKPTITEAVVNNVYELRNTGALVIYLHKALFSPAKSALLL
jgi:hypothetical protein